MPCFQIEVALLALQEEAWIFVTGSPVATIHAVPATLNGCGLKLRGGLGKHETKM